MTDLELIKKGFNAGYLLEKYDPELSSKILKSLEGKEIPYAQGYQAGMREYAKDILLEELKQPPRTREQDEDLGYDR